MMQNKILIPNFSKQIRIFFASLKSLKKGVWSGVQTVSGSGSTSQVHICGSGSKCHGSPALVSTMVKPIWSSISYFCKQRNVNIHIHEHHDSVWSHNSRRKAETWMSGCLSQDLRRRQPPAVRVRLRMSKTEWPGWLGSSSRLSPTRARLSIRMCSVGFICSSLYTGKNCSVIKKGILWQARIWLDSAGAVEWK